MKKNDILGFCVAIAGVTGVFIVAIIWMAFWSALALSVLWGWFVVPVISWPEIGLAQAYGLFLVGRTFKGLVVKDNPENKLKLKAVLLMPLSCGFLVGLGWIVKGMV